LVIEYIIVVNAILERSRGELKDYLGDWISTSLNIVKFNFSKRIVGLAKSGGDAGVV
jgi:hypothetical protein